MKRSAKIICPKLLKPLKLYNSTDQCFNFWFIDYPPLRPGRREVQSMNQNQTLQLFILISTSKDLLISTGSSLCLFLSLSQRFVSRFTFTVERKPERALRGVGACPQMWGLTSDPLLANLYFKPIFGVFSIPD